MTDTVDDRIARALPYHRLVDVRDEARKRKEKSHGWCRNLDGSPSFISREFRNRNPRLAAVAKQLCKSAEGRAKACRVPFDLTANWILHRLLAGKCDVTGLAFETSEPGSRSNFAPSVDRHVPALGYTKKNCRLVIWGYNAAKSTGTDDDVMRMAEALVRQKALKDGEPSS